MALNPNTTNPPISHQTKTLIAFIGPKLCDYFLGIRHGGDPLSTLLPDHGWHACP